MAILRIRSIYASQLIFLLLACKSRIALSGKASSTTSISTVTSPSLDDQRERIDYIQRSLCDRLDYVKAGRRACDFRQWIKGRGGEPKIFSMHGVDVNFEIDELQTLELELDIHPATRQKRNDPFLPDRINLNFHHESNRRIIFYDGDVTEYDDKPPTGFELYIRAVKLSLYFGPVLSTAWLAVISRKFRTGIWYKLLSRCLASSGAAFIKWGQWAATRSDMFPTELCEALSVLHNSAPSHSWDFTQTQIESSLDIPKGTLFEVFESIDPEPIASGSIAQIHKARLRNGEVVAAKVRHPRVAKLVDMDFRLMAMLVTVFDWLPAFKWLHIKDSVSQFSHTMAAQAHLNVEAHHLEVLNHNFQSTGDVGFPRPFFASTCVILETFEKGNIVTDVLDQFDTQAENMDNSLEGFELIPLNLANFLVTTGVSIYLKMLLVDNIMHADLHPGNIMIDVVKSGGDDEDLKSAKFQVTLVDAGMVAQLTDEESSAFVGLMTSLGAGDGNAAAEFALRFSIENNMDVVEKEKFKEEMCNFFAESCQGYGTNVDVGNVLRGVLGLIRAHHVRIDANFATLTVNALCVESLARRVCPTYNVLDAARPLLESYRKICYQEDGFTPRSKESYHKTIKKVMPMLLNGKKKNEDKAFFKRLAIQRRKEGKTMS